MEKKKIISYLFLIAVIFAVSALMPLGIETAKNWFVYKIVREKTETETETELQSEENADRMSVTIDGADQTRGSVPLLAEDLPEDTEAAEKEDTAEMTEPDEDTYVAKQSYDMELEQYREKTMPVFTETQEGNKQEFLGGRESQLSAAIADYVYSLYGGNLTIDRVDIIELVKEDEMELTYQIEVFASNGKREYTECFISTYNKEFDFYSIYAYENR